MALDLRQEVASLKKKIHELVTYNSELETYQKNAHVRTIAITTMA